MKEKRTITFRPSPKWILVPILLIGLGLRLWGIGYGLPYTYRPDEPTLIEIALGMLKTGDLNPHMFGYPSIIFYLNALVYVIYFLVGRAVGTIGSIASVMPPEVIAMGVGREVTPNLLLLGRGLTAFFGTGCILLTFLIGLRLHNGFAVALIAASLIAVSPTAIASSQSISPDTFALFFALLSLWGAVRILQDPRLRNYVLSGVGAGLAISSKYNVALIVAALIAAHFLRWGWQGWRRKELYLGLTVCVAVFLLSSPFIILDLPVFVRTFEFNASVYISEGHAGQEGDALLWYPLYLVGAEGIYVIFAILQSIYAAYTRSKTGLLLLAFPVVYFIAISRLLVRNERTVMQIVPFLALLAAVFLVGLYQRVQQTGAPRGLTLAVFISISAFTLYMPLQPALAADTRLMQIDGREPARQWIEANLPAGARVAVESYAPYIDTRRFIVQGVDAIVDHPADWYLGNGFEYLVFSEGMYGRFFAEPDRYSDWIDKYNQFFSRFTEVKHFEGNGFDVRIFRTGVVLPAHRVAARFGNDGEIIELVGYDDVTSKWMPGQPLQVKLAWRTLAEKSEPLEVELRLLDKDDREISSARGDLFQGKGWSEGIFSTDWTIPVPGDVAPRAYRLDVGVVQTRFAYRLPAKTWAGDNIEKVALGSFKLSVPPPSASELQAARPANVRFGDQVALLSYTVKTDVRAGDSLPLTLYWQSVAKPSRDYTVFVHLVDAPGKVVAQVDAQPRGGVYPTSLWDAGEVIRDAYALLLPANLAPGVYRIEIGLYEFPSLERLAVIDAKGNALGDHWPLLDSITLVP